MGKAMLEALWPMEKVTLEQVHVKVTVAVDESGQQQVYPWTDSGSWVMLHLEQVQPRGTAVCR